ncbi:hypothetical protein BHE74_00059207 [Ensete ventricosum]|nr:hypothetical protein BHE74_00059207 [Ensete ventricosum]
MDEDGEVEVGEAGGEGEEELHHYAIGTMGEGVREDEVRGGGNENAQEQQGPRDHCVPSVGLVDIHPPEVEPKAPELVASTGEA